MAHKIVMTCILMLLAIAETSTFPIAPTTTSVGYEEEGSILGVLLKDSILLPVGSSIRSP